MSAPDLNIAKSVTLMGTTIHGNRGMPVLGRIAVSGGGVGPGPWVASIHEEKTSPARDRARQVVDNSAS